MTQPVVVLLAGEASGDNLGAPLIKALKMQLPDARFVGIGGPAMIEAGLEPWYTIDALSVNGFIDPIKRLPELLKILLDMRDRTVAAAPLCFVGIDFNFFNLLLEGMLKKRGIKTVHYVSPTVWAWRQGRINSIKRKVDLMLTLYPFELDIYQQHGIPTAFVGHPKADDIDPDAGEKGRGRAREALGLGSDETVIALLPGSRGSEVSYSGPDFLGAAEIISEQLNGHVTFVVPAANEKRKAQIEGLVRASTGQIPPPPPSSPRKRGPPDAPSIPATSTQPPTPPGPNIKVTLGNSRQALEACDIALVNSGTATLEAMLLRRPMVMSYRLGAITYGIVSRLVKTDFFALPNILAKRALVPELIQKQATPEKLAAAVLSELSRDHSSLMSEFDQIHQTLRCQSGERAALAIVELVQPVPHVPA